MRVRTAVIPAAGLGTRFLPATKALPKEMLPIVDKPLLQYIVEEAVASGIEVIVIVIGRGKQAIEDHFDRSLELEYALAAKGNIDLLGSIKDISSMADICFVRQNQPLGLGHAVYCARKFIGEEPFAVLLGDDLIDASEPCLKQLLHIYGETGSSVIGIQEVDREDTSKYGIIKAVASGINLYQVVDLVEKPAQGKAPSRMAVIGRYILEPNIFAYISRLQPGAGGEIQLTDALRLLALEHPLFAYKVVGRRYDAGVPLGFLEATIEYALKRADLKDALQEYLLSVCNGANKTLS